MADVKDEKKEEAFEDASEEQLEESGPVVRPKVTSSTPTDRQPKARFKDLPGASAIPPEEEADRTMGDVAGMLREFLTVQQRREETILAEIRGLVTNLGQGPARGPHPAPMTATMDSIREPVSPRLGLPTPTPGRRPVTREEPADSFDELWRIPTSERDQLEEDQPAMDPAQPAQPQRFVRKEPKMPMYQQGEDIENYLLRFERMARTWAWPEREWACRLVPLLTGRALAAYTSMDERRSNIYKDLREAILEKFDVTTETYRQRFRTATTPPGETPTETYNRLKNLYRRWMRPEQHTKEDIGETIIMEQLINVLPYDVRTWVKEHEPKDGKTTAKLAMQYLNAHRHGSQRLQAARHPQSGQRSQTSQQFHGNQRSQATPDVKGTQDGRGTVGGDAKGNGTQNRWKDLICFYCQQTGHKAVACPLRKPKLDGFCYVPREGDRLCDDNNDNGDDDSAEMKCEVLLNGQAVRALVDTGSSVTLVKKSLLPSDNVNYEKKMFVQCVHGDAQEYPTMEVTVSVKGQMFLINAGVVESLPTDMVLGRDLPVLTELLGALDSKPASVNLSCAVFTRSQTRAGLEPLPDLCGSLCQGGSKGPRKTRSQRRIEKHMGTPVVKPEITGLESDGLWEVPENMGTLQAGDVSLKPLFDRVNGKGGDEKGVDGAKVLLENGLLYIEGDNVKRLVVPTTCRPLVLHLAHTLPWAGHLALQKTYLRLSSRFYWPSMYNDVRTYCATCPVCQKTGAVRRANRVPLHPLPMISTPFQRIAMDIVGPLEKSSSGYRFILVICDYATRYPEAFPLRSITTPKVISALVQLFSRVGFPKEILTDQGTNFTSRLMQQLHQQLGIKALRTTPYHPQTDGLVERFNHTLKNMLRKFVSDTGKDWDKWLPFLLFAYREVPQASTGFSPFELVYGWQVQGPLDLLKKSWERPAEASSEVGIVQYVLRMRDRLDQYREEAAENLRQAQKAQKLWYDQYARHREYQPGQKVLLLLPTSTSKLLAKWQGPYVITRKMGPVTYEVHHPDKGKKTQVYHVNLMKEWKERTIADTKVKLENTEMKVEVAEVKRQEAKVMMVRKVEADGEDGEDVQAWRPRTAEAVTLDHLKGDLRKDLLEVFGCFPSLFQPRPGRTGVLEHKIHLKDPTPIRQRPYRVPETLVSGLRDEIRIMQELGVIEASTSEWSSPIVVVPKKDGTLRICMDFRKLNAVSQFDAYPMPRIDDLLEKIGRARYITTLDLCKGYWQVPLEEKSREYTAFRTPLGLFQFTVMPFGLHGAPATFQRLMDRVLQGCDDCCAAYLDDVVIFSQTWAEHCQHLQKVLQRIQGAGLTLNVRKCEWARAETKYLGYLVGHGEVRPQVDKVEAIKNSSRPRTRKQVRSFLGLVGWYRRFIPNFSTIAAPLTDLTSKAARNPVQWTEECERAFNTLKICLCSSPVLQSADFTQRFLVQVDASSVGIGAVLAQGKPGEERPVLYLSRKLLPREQRYSTIEKECLAIKWALESLRYYLLGREFDLDTDHRALTWIQTMKDHNARVTRWYLALQPYRFQIRHKSGKQNLLADYLSRLPMLCNLGEGEGNVTERSD